MPIVLALFASAGIHLAVLLGPGWDLPGLAPDDDAPLNATLLPPPKLAPSIPLAPVKPHRPPPAKPLVRPSAPPAAPAIEAIPANTPIAPAAAASVDAPIDAPAPETPADVPATPPDAVPSAPTFTPPPTVADAALPDAGNLRFIITRGDGGFIIGRNLYTWTQADGRYTARSVSETTGLAALFKTAKAVQESRGEITAAGLRPLSFRNDRNGKVDSAEFDWQAGKLRYDGHEDALPPGTQDLLSMYYQLGVFVAMQGDVPLEMPIATGRKLAVYRFERLADTHIFYRDADYPAVHLRTRNGGDTIELWIARDVSLLPVRIRLVDRKGEIFDQLAEEAALTYNNEHSQ